jgi:hypothetical protein
MAKVFEKYYAYVLIDLPLFFRCRFPYGFRQHWLFSRKLKMRWQTEN